MAQLARRDPHLNFGVYDEAGDLCAYARVVTDQATFAWFCDVYLDRDHRGQGLGLPLVRAVVDRPSSSRSLRCS
ncbi:GNAT family N-acetyltransferase [Leifsonia sp. NPDC058230]|uniref:GNAT family N-acetyltransferase n=1 Tax=Leifsonia sp. NPDC058230 TaxID=3346391 RepID=UPI0036D92AD9